MLKHTSQMRYPSRNHKVYLYSCSCPNPFQVYWPDRSQGELHSSCMEDAREGFLYSN